MERAIVTVSMFCVFVLTIFSLIIPALGYILLVFEILGVIAVVSGGVVLLWNTRFTRLSKAQIETARRRRQKRRHDPYDWDELTRM